MVAPAFGVTDATVSASVDEQKLGCPLTIAIISLGHVVGIENFVVVGLGKRVRVASSKGEVAFQLALQAKKGVAHQAFDLSLFAHDRNEVSEAGALAVEAQIMNVSQEQGCTDNIAEELTLQPEVSPLASHTPHRKATSKLDS